MSKPFQRVAVTGAAFASVFIFAALGTAHADSAAHSGTATEDAAVAVDGIADDLGQTGCAGKNPIGPVDNLWAPEVEISSALMGGTAECGKTITITSTSTSMSGKRATRSVQATIVDRCAACSGDGIDLTPSAFNKLAPSGTATQVSWTFD